MTKNKKIVQLILISFGFLLILVTYFLYPQFKKSTLKESVIKKDVAETDSNWEGNIFENIEYRGIYNVDKQFIIKSEKAQVLTKNPDIVYMKYMKITLYMNDGRMIYITSDKGRYNKVTYDSYFEDNVKATDGKTVILSENLDLVATEDFASIYNDVVLTNESNSLRADKIEYDFVTKNYHISMFGKSKVKIKLVQ